MAEVSMVSEEMKAVRGRVLSTQVIQIDKAMIEKRVEAVQDQNPLWQDQDFARSSKYGGVIAPPYILYGLEYLAKPSIPIELVGLLPFKPSFKQVLDGGVEFEFFRAVRPGDFITIAIVLHDILERNGKSGKLLFVSFEMNYLNQEGQMVGRAFRKIILC